MKNSKLKILYYFYYIASAIGFIALIVYAVLNVFNRTSNEWIYFSRKAFPLCVLINVAIHTVFWAIRVTLYKRKKEEFKADIKKIIIEATSAIICIAIIIASGVLNKQFSTNVYDALRDGRYEYEDERVSIILQNEPGQDEPLICFKNKDSNETFEYTIPDRDNYDKAIKLYIPKNLEGNDSMVISARRFFGDRIEIRILVVGEISLQYLKNEAIRLVRKG